MDSGQRTTNWNETHHAELPVVFGTLHFEEGRIFSSTIGGAINFNNDDGDSSFTLTDLQIEGDLNHSGNNIGFFGAVLAIQQAVDDLVAPTSEGGGVGATAATVASVNTALSDITDKLNAALAALRLYGLLAV